MSIQLTYYYLQLQWQRTKSAYIKLMMARSHITNIAKLIIAGIDPADSEYKEEYAYLIGEFGEGIFTDEVNKLRLVKEEENIEN